MTVHQAPQYAHAFCDDALGNDDATAIAERIRRGDITATEAANAALARAHKVDRRIRAVAFLDEALKVTPPATLTVGAFAGVPTFIKDNADVQGLPSGHGSAAVTPRASNTHSPFTEQYLAQGFCVLGKSRLPEFGFNATTEPQHESAARNPWNLGYSTGASSGGSAALVAAGVVPIAHANDGGGSIRIPAACCGLVGLKPTRGRLLDNEAARSLPINIVSEGVVTRSVRDTANFYAAAEQFFANRKLPAIGRVTGAGSKRLSIGLVMDSITGRPTDTITRATVEQTTQLLQSMGHTVETMPVPIPDSFPDDFALYWGMLAFAIRSAGTRLVQPEFDKTRVDILTNGLADMFKRQCYRIPATLWRLKRSQQAYAKALTGYDAVLTPVLGHTTPLLGHLSPDIGFDELFERLRHYVNFTPLANATGAPALALPMSSTPAQLPVSVQFMAPHGQERTLLELAFELEQAAPWRQLYY